MADDRRCAGAEAADSDRRLLLTSGAVLGASALAALLARIGEAGAQDGQDQVLTLEDMIGKTLRVYHTGDAVTLDYSENRLNVELGADDRVVRVSIG
jgi:hypothetical protein